MASESVDPNDCQVQAGSNWTPHQISIDRNQTLEKRLNDLSRQTGYSFVQANGQRYNKSEQVSITEELRVNADGIHSPK